MDIFAAIVADARQIAGMSAAEFDYSLTCGQCDQRAGAALDNAIWYAANRGYPEVVPGDPTNESRARRERYEALRTELAPQVEAMIAAAKGKSYIGWSEAARARGQKVRYAS